MKIAVYAISKNEEQFVKTFCESSKLADYILIADTGSTDGTVEEAKKYGAVVHSICITPWRFDHARNAALALLPADIDVCISLDLDEQLEPGWREELERLWKPETTRLSYKFDWGHGKVFYSTKVHTRKGYHWHHPCHEYIRPDHRTKEVFAYSEMLMITHHPDETKSRGQYLDLLEMSVKEDPLCPRNAFYYARELTYYQKWDEAIKELHRYLELPQATWHNERAYAFRLIGNSHDALGGDGMNWYRRAVSEDPSVRETWCELATAAYKRGLWAECYGAASNALLITEPTYVYTMDAANWGAKPHDLKAIAAYRLGLKDEAIRHGEEAVKLEPNNERLIKNLEFYKE
jgi:glycosyltransferase involved in cell wall biosynthesis